MTHASICESFSLSLSVALVSALLAGGTPLFERASADGIVSRPGISVERARLRNILVAFQIAVSVILLAGATLLVRSFRNLQAEPLGIVTRGVMALDIPLTAHVTPQRSSPGSSSYRPREPYATRRV